MKLFSRHSRAASGNSLMLTLVATALIGFLLLAYLQLVRSQHGTTMRSQGWNGAMAIVEAGIEDALTHLNVNTNTLAVQGWEAIDGDKYAVRRYLGDNYYEVTISNWVADSTNMPVVESRGYFVAPLTVAAVPGPFFAATAAPKTRTYLSRGVRVVAQRRAMFSKGMVAVGHLDVGGKNIYVDSFDSTDPNKNINGKWHPARRQDGGSIASNSGLINSLNVGGAKIYGEVFTPPGGAVQIGSGSVGDSTWVNSGATGVQPGHHTDDMNMEFEEVGPPFAPGSGFALANPPRTLAGGNYQMSSLKMSGNAKMTVTGNAILYVTGDVDISGKASITIAPGGSLKLYVAGSNTSIGGNGIVNETDAAINFGYYGLPSNKTIKFHGNGEFTGTIYAPEADLILAGGGSGDGDFSGASVTKTVKFNGHFKFHYDEALRRLILGKGYVVYTWNEMTPGDVRAAPVF